MKGSLLNDTRLPTRFWDKVSPEPNTGCWLWAAATNDRGYAVIGVGSRKLVYAHRFAYEALVSEIPEGLQLDHLCRVRCCVNPAHLEPVTQSENLRRGMSRNRDKTACPSGHEYSASNTRVYRGMRYCKVCETRAFRASR